MKPTSASARSVPSIRVARRPTDHPSSAEDCPARQRSHDALNDVASEVSQTICRSAVPPSFAS
jgi:hypothetical protein